MSASFGWTARSALLSSVLLVGSWAAAAAAPPSSTPPSAASLTAADQAAGRAAADDLRRAITMMNRNDGRSARALLERAETALLNRESLDLGPALKIGQPLPATPALQGIKQAEKGLQESHRIQAIDAAKQALAALGAETAPRTSA